VEFFERLDDDRAQADVFAFFKRLSDGELAVPFLRYLHEVAADAWLARSGIKGAELLLPHLLDPLPDRVLLGLPAECDRLIRRISRNNLNIRLALAALYTGLRQAFTRSA
jgi:hypothetical protein